MADSSTTGEVVEWVPHCAPRARVVVAGLVSSS
jgi:hypothetical protein